MPITKKINHIIVGQGLAGSCLALELFKRGKEIRIFDLPEENRASSVAAGLFNPITGNRMTKSWSAEKMFPALFQFYREAERRLERKFLYEEPIYRPFISVEEQNEWMAQSENPAVKPFVKEVFTSAAYEQAVNPFGGIVINQSGYLDVNAFMEAVRVELKKKDAYSNALFDPTQIKIKNNAIEYAHLTATSIVFCEGVRAAQNPFFHWLPIRPLKGETITISLDQRPEAIFNRGVYLVPTSKDNSFIVGATYQGNDDTPVITAAAKAELEEKLKGLITMQYQVTHQSWGIRPTTPDRKPILGAHPLYKNLVVFNGLGTKGVSLAPYFSALLADWFEGRAEIQNEVNIQRFKPLYSKLSSL
ncbi:MAG TPA: FAD-dependent oxidoreductase [Cyclobacteriaceae bacterium]|nr:FAD-dependent oxidoreductase [Cyclobacteriaceae bacterium]